MQNCMCIIRSYIWIAGLFTLVNAIPRIDYSSNLLDEVYEEAVYNAVVESMNEWQLKQNLKKNLNRTKRDEPTVCYDDLGCFDASGPFGYLDMLPSKPEEINTRFLLYPARNRQRRSGSAPTEVPFEKLDEAFEWAKSGFNKSLPTKVLIHGFGSDCGYIWAYEIRSALMAVEEANTICVDWSNGAALPNYVKASANTRLVGKQLSLLLRGLVEQNDLSLMNTHLIGFSLGAHIAGFAGADLANLSRITGLDPAGPLFESQDTRARLDETDASFVDVIHSNGENLILGGLGSSQPMGHVDFYPNGGRMQKGCSHLFVGAVSDIIWSSAVEGRSLCNHRRAYKFFIDSVSPRCHFPAFPCDSYDNFIAGNCFPCTEERKCGNMGYYADRSKGRGQLYLITRDEEPFCAHQYLIKIETTPSTFPVKSYGKIQVTLIGDSFLNESFVLTKKDDEELKLGESLSKIVVLHPILSQPTKIEILYTAYSGWLSSGLTQWKVEKVMLMDSFGKIYSVCKKSLILQSGIPVILPLLPRNCSVFDDDSNSDEEEEMRKEEDRYPGYLNNKDENSISLDTEAESSRAFNSRIIKTDEPAVAEADSAGPLKEVVEPILKTHSTKNGRSHVPDKEKSEITEPILGPTTQRSNSSLKTIEENETNVIGDSKRVPKEPKAFRDPDSVHRLQQPSQPPNPLDAIVTTVQFLPQRLAKMFEQAEKYARETILPLVSTYTPRFISDFIGPREEPKYVPLRYEEDEIQQTSSSKRIGTTAYPQSRSLPVNGPDQGRIAEAGTTPYSHIQRINKKKATNDESGASELTTTTTTTPSSTSSTPNIVKPKPHFNIKIDYGRRQESQSLERKKKRENNDETYIFDNQIGSGNNASNATLMQTLANTLQNIPDNFLRVLGQVQDYTRRTILPFVQNYSPRSLSDLIWIRPRPNTTLNVQKVDTNTSTVQSRNVSVSWSISRDINVTTTTEMVQKSIMTTTAETISNFIFENAIENSKSAAPVNPVPIPNHIQRIPKKGQKVDYKIPKPFTIVINPDDLTTTTTTTTTAKPKPTLSKKFVSYIQKIPKKKDANKIDTFKVIKKHPWNKDVVAGGKVISVKNRHGADVVFRVSSDGRYEV